MFYQPETYGHNQQYNTNGVNFVRHTPGDQQMHFEPYHQQIFDIAYQVPQMNQVPQELTYQEPEMRYQVGEYTIDRDLDVSQPMVKECLAVSSTGQHYLMRVYDLKMMESKADNLGNFVKWEQEVLSKVSHANLIQLYEGLQSDTNVFNVLTLASRETLHDIISKMGVIPEREAKQFLFDAMSALTYLHTFPHFPRIITNSCFRLNGNMLVLDLFGSNRNRDIIMKRRPPFFTTESPEVLTRGESLTLDLPSDIWSLGACYYEMIFGKLPWHPSSDANQYLQLLYKYSGEGLHFPSEIQTTDECKRLLRRMLHPDPKCRITWDEFCVLPYFGVSVQRDSEFYDAIRDEIDMNDRNSLADQSFSVKDEINNSLFSSMIVRTTIHKEPIEDFVEANPAPPKNSQNDQRVPLGSVTVADRLNRVAGPLSVKKRANLSLAREDEGVPAEDSHVAHSMDKLKYRATTQVRGSTLHEYPKVQQIQNNPPTTQTNGVKLSNPTPPQQVQAQFQVLHRRSENSTYHPGNRLSTTKRPAVPPPSVLVPNTHCRIHHEQRLNFYTHELIDDLEGMVSLLRASGNTGIYWQGYLAAAVLCAQKIVNSTQNMIESIKYRRNFYGMPDFNDFLNSDISKLLRAELEEELETHNAVLQNLLLHLQAPGLDPGLALPVLENIRLPREHQSISVLLTNQTVWLYTFFLQNKILFSEELRKEIRIVLAILYMVTDSDYQFQFSRNNMVFNWDVFEKQASEEYYKQTYKTGTEWYLNAKDMSVASALYHRYPVVLQYVRM